MSQTGCVWNKGSKWKMKLTEGTWLILIFWYTHQVLQNVDDNAYPLLFPTFGYLLTHMDLSGGFQSDVPVALREISVFHISTCVFTGLNNFIKCGKWYYRVKPYFYVTCKKIYKLKFWAGLTLKDPRGCEFYGYKSTLIYYSKML